MFAISDHLCLFIWEFSNLWIAYREIDDFVRSLSNMDICADHKASTSSSHIIFNKLYI